MSWQEWINLVAIWVNVTFMILLPLGSGIVLGVSWLVERALRGARSENWRTSRALIFEHGQLAAARIAASEERKARRRRDGFQRRKWRWIRRVILSWEFTSYDETMLSTKQAKRRR